tara:strand:- start:325 stop:1422 length:1098 start_codon:yes stop_codon:yes gene_type:complete
VVLSPPFFFKNIKMGVNVNTVYTTVLSILNKEQRGYITPDEFNKLAIQVQLEEFEKFFEDYNQYLRMPKTDEEFASRVDHIREEFQVFEKTESASAHISNVYTQPIDLHRFGSATYTKANGQPPIEITSSIEYRQQVLSPLLQPSLNFPIAKYKQDKLTVFPPLSTFSNSDISFNYIRKPQDVRWGYTVGSLGQYIYDPTAFDTTSLAVKNIISSSNLTSTTCTVGNFTMTQGNNTSSQFIYNNNGGGTGTGATITVSTTLSPMTKSNATILVKLVGSGYAVGDLITIPTTNSALNPAANIVITLTANDLMGSTGQGSLQFEISDSLQTDLILGILKYSGIIINDQMIMRAANGIEQQDEQNSKK